jgi:hypothetical protein
MLLKQKKSIKIIISAITPTEDISNLDATQGMKKGAIEIRT